MTNVILTLTQLFSWGAMFILWVFALPLVRGNLGLDERAALHWVGLGLALYASLAAALNFVMPRVIAQLGMARTHGLALLIGALGIDLIAHAMTPALLLAGYGLTSIGWASLSNTPYAMINAQVTDGRYDRAMARFNLTVVAPQVVLALALGWLLDKVPSAQAVMYASMAMALAGGIMLIFTRKAHQP